MTTISNYSEPELFKRTNTGAIHTWKIEHNSIDSYRVISGQYNGTLTFSTWKKVIPKNIGKSNERDHYQQLIAEINSEYSKKKSNGYYENINDIDKGKSYFAPMLAKEYDDHKHKIPNTFSDVFVQPKLDGVRCIIDSTGMWTRNGKPIVSCPHIYEFFEPILMKFPDTIIDGELYNHDLKDDFNEIVSLVKKQKINPKSLSETKNKIQFWAFDLPSVNDNFSIRNDELEKLIKAPNNYIIKCPTQKITTQQQMDLHYEGVLQLGFEGQMIRWGQEPYQNKRTDSLLKRKEFVDNEFKIVDIVEGEGNSSGMAGYIILELGDGRTFKANAMGDREIRSLYLRERVEYIGGQATVIEFAKRTPDGIPRFPRAKMLYKLNERKI